MVPHYGFRFNPTDEELIEILHCKASGDQISSLNFIPHVNIYEHEPQLLQWDETLAVGKDERYYFCQKESDSREVAGRGWWKATSHVKKIYVNGNVVGLKRPLTFHKYRDDQTNRGNAIKTNWIMHEFSLNSKHTEWRLCKLKYKGRPSLQEEMENIRQTRYSSTYHHNLQPGNSVNNNVAESSSNGEVENQLSDVPYSTIPADQYYNDNDSWLHFSSTSATSIDGNFYDHQYMQYIEPIEEQHEHISALWSWQD